MTAYQDLTGQRFGRLVAIAPGGKGERGCTLWRCICDCGNIKNFRSGNLKNKHTRSCGCLKVELAGNQGKTHGMSGTKTYGIWRSIKTRCLDSNSPYYHYYGGRGITICDRWIESFENFLADMGEAPEGLSIDRINNNGSYEPGNCRWATALEQAENRNSAVLITFKSQTQSQSNWEKELGFKRGTLAMRLSRGWSIEEALTTPLGHRRKLFCAPQSLK